MSDNDKPTVLVSGQEKITPHHLERMAYIYVRQSSPGQVANNKESALNQRLMAKRAAALGWRPDQIRILHTDQGLSGKGSDPRLGFQELVAEVSLGHVGIILGYEVSRLARNNSDWYRLMELADALDTLIGDYDGIYEPGAYNDRLLLGLKGTISEAELHLLRLRMEAGRMRQIERGAYRQGLPTGLVRLPDGTVVKDPDDQVRHSIELVLVKFEELRSARQVLRYLRDHNIRLPRRHIAGIHAGELLWKPAEAHMVYAIVHNPAYAGAFVYGRTQVDPSRRQSEGQDGQRGDRVRKPMEAWIHIEQDVYPAYITWEQYVTNQEQLCQNAMRFAEDTVSGAPRSGTALLQGLVLCGLCGHRMTVRYAYNHQHRYVCEKMSRWRGAPMCASLQGKFIDAAITQAFFDAIQPAQLDVLEAVLAAQQTEYARLMQHWDEQLKRTQYDMRLAQRQYDAVDPDNRLVAAELERRWEEKLQQLREVEDAYEQFQLASAPPTLTPEVREQFRALSDTLPTLWNSGQLPNEHKKSLLRSLIANVVLTKQAPGLVEARVVWVSGHYSIVSAAASIKNNRDLPRYHEMVARIDTLWHEGYTDAAIAAQLTAEGFRSTRSLEVLPLSVKGIRHENGWKRHWVPNRKPRLYAMEGYLTVSAVAERLGVRHNWVYYRILDETIDSQYVIRHPKFHNFMIQDVPEVMEQLQQRLLMRRRI